MKQRSHHNRKQRNRHTAQRSIGAATTRRSTPVTNDTAHVRGRDRIFHLADVSTLKDGAEIFFSTFQPSMIARLSHLASAYQRIRYTKLSFRIVAQVPSITPGGYVAAFIGDPNESLPDTKKLEYLVTNTGARTTALWASTTVNCPAYRLRQTYWTHKPTANAKDPDDTLRIYSPGSLAVVFEGSTGSQKGSLSIEVDWAATLTGATLDDVEDDIETRAYAVPQDNQLRWSPLETTGFKIKGSTSLYGMVVTDNNNRPYDFSDSGIPANAFISSNETSMMASLQSSAPDVLGGYYKTARVTGVTVTHVGFDTQNMINPDGSTYSMQLGLPAAFNELTQKLEVLEKWTLWAGAGPGDVVRPTVYPVTAGPPGTMVFTPGLDTTRIYVNGQNGLAIVTREHLKFLGNLSPVIPKPEFDLETPLASN